MANHELSTAKATDGDSLEVVVAGNTRKLGQVIEVIAANTERLVELAGKMGVLQKHVDRLNETLTVHANVGEKHIELLERTLELQKSTAEAVGAMVEHMRKESTPALRDLTEAINKVPRDHNFLEMPTDLKK